MSMPGENLSLKISRITSEVNSLESRLRRIETVLEQFRPQFLQIKDISGKLRRYSALARFEGTATDLNYGLPFEIKDVSKANTPRVAVYKHSSLRKSLLATDRQVISGLDDGKGNGDFSVSEGTLIWLEISFKNGNVNSAKIEHGEKWGNYPEPMKFEQNADSGQELQAKAFVPIAKIVKFEESLDNRPPGIALPKDLMVSQYLNTHLVMLNTCYQNIQCIYPFPHAGQVL